MIGVSTSLDTTLEDYLRHAKNYNRLLLRPVIYFSHLRGIHKIRPYFRASHQVHHRFQLKKIIIKQPSLSSSKVARKITSTVLQSLGWSYILKAFPGKSIKKHFQVTGLSWNVRVLRLMDDNTIIIWSVFSFFQLNQHHDTNGADKTFLSIFWIFTIKYTIRSSSVISWFASIKFGCESYVVEKRS